MNEVIVIRRSQSAFGMGHVGWAYQQSNGTWMCGATENPKSCIGCSGEDKGFWSLPYAAADVPSIFGTARKLPAGMCPPYTDYKIVKAARPNTAEAWSRVCWCRKRPFEVPYRDCLDDTYDILTAFGVKSLPPPIVAAPNLWFDLIRSTSRPVPRGGPVPPARREKKLVKGAPSIWRVHGTPEFEELNELLATYSWVKREVDRPTGVA
jgi:hypothetical protein